MPQHDHEHHSTTTASPLPGHAHGEHTPPPATPPHSVVVVRLDLHLGHLLGPDATPARHVGFIAIGVLAAYLASACLTVIGQPTAFYEAAAMLVTFVPFGHWMEMRSRRGTSDALRALFDLVPPTARVLRSGVEVVLPTSEVLVGD